VLQHFLDILTGKHPRVSRHGCLNPDAMSVSIRPAGDLFLFHAAGTRPSGSWKRKNPQIFIVSDNIP
jgi:hypothetical protein